MWHHVLTAVWLGNNNRGSVRCKLALAYFMALALLGAYVALGFFKHEDPLLCECNTTRCSLSWLRYDCHKLTLTVRCWTALGIALGVVVTDVGALVVHTSQVRTPA